MIRFFKLLYCVTGWVFWCSAIYALIQIFIADTPPPTWVLWLGVALACAHEGLRQVKLAAEFPPREFREFRR